MSASTERDWVLRCGRRYWGAGESLIADLPIAHHWRGPTKPVDVPLPDWAADIGVNGSLLVDGAVIEPGEGPTWQRCDWLCAAWLMLTGAAERNHEARHGPILSYAFRLDGVDARVFDRAWVNRIFLFLRRWAAQSRETDEAGLFGQVPSAEVTLTHDVDALAKTLEIRAKQGAFNVWNAAKSALGGNLPRAGRSFVKGLSFAVGPGDFRTFGHVRQVEDAAGIRSILHFYAGKPGWSRGSPARLLIDPAYDIQSPEMVDELKAFHDGGWTVGLHQSTAAWELAAPMARERDRLQGAASGPVADCRQHWLRFSWDRTWQAQEEAGLRSDSTLGFNDRPGFRNGAALTFHPWDHAGQRELSLKATPMVFMDSHFYDYAPMNDADRFDTMRRWLDEIRAVGGQATVNWHTHTITDAYGWGGGYRQLIDLL